ncbi:30S ribosomal protein S16 [Candidatus Uhrbacteria bacterium RIFCSPHIGHO2_02_FULL_57_19]|uniref:Small ribosomal subunit protein bS16 n=1 Tax=Candidatus Uhrbacteria bacterium RIFCSPHIGHO2_02_FULL_57_19 TaxID=1802391 RepID=A0A1F7U7S4_9BACT|nr:MAG: 30S ribosomal protein S16 [Candidatus Uhrbacteria bacterium RIFCSPHIGHO2_02_FULL_57_19]
MLSIRLTRVGKKKKPSFRLVIMDKRRDPWGKSLENLGVYNPQAKPKVIQFKADRINFWMSKGAKPTPTVWNLLVEQKIIEGKKTKAHPTHKKAAAEAKPAEKKEAAPAA